MIPKIICLLFGHKRWEDFKVGIVENTFTTYHYKCERIWYDVCPRCGKKLK